jgi:hypothetical protein
MLFVDDRAGSSDLVPGLQRLGLPVTVKRLTSGDIMFTGRGERGAPVVIGIEHKRLSDLIQSLNDGRLVGTQIPAMLAMFDRSHLIIEGDWQRETDGSVSVWKSTAKRGRLKGSPNALELRKRIRTIEIRTGVRVEWALNRRWALDFIATEYRWWTDADLDEHRSHLAIHAPDVDTQLKMPMSDFRASIQRLLPGVGFAASKVIEDMVSCIGDDGKPSGSMRRLCLLTLSDWATLELPDRHGKVKRLGEKRATAIMRKLDTWSR